MDKLQLLEAATKVCDLNIHTKNLAIIIGLLKIVDEKGEAMTIKDINDFVSEKSKNL